MVDRLNRHRRDTAAKERSGAPAHSKRPFKYEKEMSFLSSVAGDKALKGNVSSDSDNDTDSNAGRGHDTNAIDMTIQNEECTLNDQIMRRLIPSTPILGMQLELSGDSGSEKVMHAYFPIFYFLVL